MIIRLGEVPATGQTYQGEEPPEIIDVSAELGVRLLAPITYDLHALRAPATLLVSGTLSTRVEFRCSRCDEPFERAYEDREFDRAWELTPDGLQWIGPLGEDPPEQEVADEKGDVFRHPVGAGNRDCVDLTEDIREAIILAFSGYPVCNPDCKGLCASCGMNLNKAACRCTPPDENRWTILDQFGTQ
ncbi:MAG: DUF177 domain-containing protein [Verrucomicrobia bacterium]|nr:DUF177 domain-containing protein [Verrucomicrobiota bacterium]